MTVYRANSAARFVTPQSDPAPDAHAAWIASRIEAIDVALAEIAVVPPPVRSTEQWYRLDRLLDLRWAIRPVRPLPLRPSVPVVPGRPS